MDVRFPARVAIHLWGDLRVVDEDGEPIVLTNARARACLALLASAVDRTLSRDRLAAMLWGDRSDEHARANLRQLLYELKPLTQTSPPLMGFDRRTAWLEAACETDAQMMQRAGDAQLATLVPHRGVLFLADLDGVSDEFDDWLATERAASEATLRRAVLDHAQQAFGRYDFEAVRALADAWANRDASDETIAQFGLRADGELADRAGFARRLRRLESVLATELGVRPSAATRAIVHEYSGGREPLATPGTAPEPPRADLVPPASPSLPRRWPPRRWSVAAVAALLIVAASGLAAWAMKSGAHDPATMRAAAQHLTATARGLSRSRTPAGFADAAALARRAIAKDPRYAPAWAELAFTTWMRSACDEKRTPGSLADTRQEALEYDERALALQPDLGRALAVRSLIAGTQADRAWLEKAVIQAPDDPEAWLWLGNQRISDGLVRESMTAYRKSFELDPLWERSVVAYVASATELGEHDAVDRALDRFAAASPNPFAVESAREIVGSRRGDLISAAQHLSLALTLAPESPHDELSELARIARAVGDSEGLLRLSANYADLHQAWAPIYDPQGAPARARAALPSSWWSAQYVVVEMRNLLNAGRGDLLLEQVDRQGVPLLDAYQPEEGGVVAAYSMIAMALRAAGRDAEAALLLSAARAQVDRMEANHYPYFTQDLDMAAIFALEGRSDEAVAALGRAVDKQWRGQIWEWAVDPGDEPAFASLRGRDDFEQARRRLAANIARLRPQVEAILARTPPPAAKAFIAEVAAGEDDH